MSENETISQSWKQYASRPGWHSQGVSNAMGQMGCCPEFHIMSCFCHGHGLVLLCGTHGLLGVGWEWVVGVAYKGCLPNLYIIGWSC